MVVKFLAHKPHLSPFFWGLSYLHHVDLLHIFPNNSNTSPYFLWYNRPFDLLQQPILLFGSVIAAQRPLPSQTALSGRSIESLFVGIAHSHTSEVILFNPATKRTYVRQSFKYLSDDDPISTSYVVFTDSSPPSTPAEPISDHLANLDPIIDPSEDFQYATVPLSRAPSNIIKFAYLTFGKDFIKKSTNISYRIHDIVRVTSSSSLPTLCLQFVDISSNLTPPTDSFLFEYEPIQQFFADKNYIINNNNSNIVLPTRPTRKLRRVNMLKAKINSNVSQIPMSIASALRYPNAADFMASFASEIASL